MVQKYVVCDENFENFGKAIEWNKYIFESEITNMTNTYIELDHIHEGESMDFPGGYILPCILEEVEEYDPLYYYVSDEPDIRIEKRMAFYSYPLIERDLNSAKDYLIKKLAHNRWMLESNGMSYNYDEDDIITIPTEREDRNILFQASFLIPDDGFVYWKFKEGYRLVTKEKVFEIVKNIAVFVEQCFTAEHLKKMEIDQCTTLEQLSEINIDSNKLLNDV
jgi:hypothetical protein